MQSSYDMTCEIRIQYPKRSKSIEKKLAKIDKMHIHHDLSRPNVTTE